MKWRDEFLKTTRLTISSQNNEKKENIQINKTKDYKGGIATNTEEIQRAPRTHLKISIPLK